MIDLDNFNSPFSIASYFNNDKTCKKSKNGRFHCKKCNHNFSCTVGTIFENTKLPLRKWFMAMYLISSHQLSMDIEVTQKTAWYMLQKIRLLFPQTDETPMNGTVECDEVYIGGTHVNRPCVLG